MDTLTCRCGSAVLHLASGKAPHLASLVCENDHWVKWIGKQDLAKWKQVTSVIPQPVRLCDIQFYGFYSGYYVSLTFTCSGGLITETFYDHLMGQDVEWHLCEGHAWRLLSCQTCGTGKVSPYSPMQQCVYCASGER